MKVAMRRNNANRRKVAPSLLPSEEDMSKEDLKVCHFCGKPLSGRQSKFCCQTHAEKFKFHVNSGLKISIKIDEKTSFSTDKYDKIPRYIKMYKELKKKI
jgi:hypothetical protein